MGRESFICIGWLKLPVEAVLTRHPEESEIGVCLRTLKAENDLAATSYFCSISNSRLRLGPSSFCLCIVKTEGGGMVG